MGKLSIIASVALVLVLRSGNSKKIQCGNSTTYCDSETSSPAMCCKAQYSPSGFGCAVAQESDPNVCCLPGPPLEPSRVLPNCLVIGDSVSIGYTSRAATQLADAGICQLQHGPYDVTDGGAADTTYGLACLGNFLRTQRQTIVPWDVILFNFGLHNLNNSAQAKQVYKDQLGQITDRLLRQKRVRPTKILYATTTPFMEAALQNNTIVEDLNEIALGVMSPHEIDIVDLHSTVTNHCGELYAHCDWCELENCGLHYNAVGNQALSVVIANAFSNALNVSSAAI